MLHYAIHYIDSDQCRLRSRLASLEQDVEGGKSKESKGVQGKEAERERERKQGEQGVQGKEAKGAGRPEEAGRGSEEKHAKSHNAAFPDRTRIIYNLSATRKLTRRLLIPVSVKNKHSIKVEDPLET